MVILHSTFIYMVFQCFLYSLLLNLTVEIITNPVLFHARFVLIDQCVESTVESGQVWLRIVMNVMSTAQWSQPQI